jgi:hypothetical protein
VSVTPPSSWPWVDHPVSGLRRATVSPCSDSVSLRLPYSVKLATQRKSLTHYTKGTPSLRHSMALPFRDYVLVSRNWLQETRSITAAFAALVRTMSRARRDLTFLVSSF